MSLYLKNQILSAFFLIKKCFVNSRALYKKSKRELKNKNDTVFLSIINKKLDLQT